MVGTLPSARPVIAAQDLRMHRMWGLGPAREASSTILMRFATARARSHAE